MKVMEWILVIILTLLVLVYMNTNTDSGVEGFEGLPDMSEITTQALDAPPSTSELKNHYKALLIYVNDDIRNNGHKGFRILADFRNRVYGRCDFRDNLKTDDVLASWPAWLPPLDTSITEPVPPVDDAVTAETKMLAYLARNFPKEPTSGSDENESTVRNLIEDFGYRFVFKKGVETHSLAPDFAPTKLLKDWVNPVAPPNNKSAQRKAAAYRDKCIPSTV